MIGKIVKGRSFKACVSYVFRDKEAELLASEGVLATDVNRLSTAFLCKVCSTRSCQKVSGIYRLPSHRKMPIE